LGLDSVLSAILTTNRLILITAYIFLVNCLLVTSLWLTFSVGYFVCVRYMFDLLMLMVHQQTRK